MATQIRQHPDRVLVLGDDMRIFLAVARSLGRTGKEVHAAPFDWDAPALASRFVTKVHRLPRYQDDPQQWLTAIGRVIEEEGIRLVIPCDDRVILPLDAHRAAFESCAIAIPDAGAMEWLFDKERTKAMAQSLGIPVASGGALAATDTAASVVEKYGLPVVLKPRRSYWLDRLDSWGRVHIPRDRDELEAALSEIDDRSRYMVEAFFEEGIGVGVSVLANGGVMEQAFQHRRMREGWGGSSSYRISQTLDPALLDACRKICAHTGLTGVCMFEFRLNPASGSWILLETNARFWGSCGLPIALGVDFPVRLFDLLVHGRSHPPTAYASGVRSRNIALDGLNLLRSLRRVPRSGFGGWLLEVGDFLLQPLRWAQGRETSDSFVRDDVAPGIAELRRLTEMMFARNHSRQRDRRRSDKPEAAAPVAQEQSPAA